MLDPPDGGTETPEQVANTGQLLVRQWGLRMDMLNVTPAT